VGIRSSCMDYKWFAPLSLSLSLSLTHTHTHYKSCCLCLPRMVLRILVLRTLFPMENSPFLFIVNESFAYFFCCCLLYPLFKSVLVLLLPTSWLLEFL
jgi:hypothetical protein